MLIAGITTRFLSVFATVIVVISCILTIRYLERLKKRLSTSVVLVPLYKSKISLIIGEIIILTLLIITIIDMASASILYVHINLIIMLVSVFALLMALIMQRFAVIDTGVIVPYRYIDWIAFSDFEIEGKTVYFTGDKDGFSSLVSTTVRLSFNTSDLNKLQLVLTRNKKNTK